MAAAIPAFQPVGAGGQPAVIVAFLTEEFEQGYTGTLLVPDPAGS